MPSQHFPNQVAVPEFKQLVLYTGNVMRTSTAASKYWNKKSNAEVKSNYLMCNYKQQVEGSLLILIPPLF